MNFMSKAITAISLNVLCNQFEFKVMIKGEHLTLHLVFHW